MNNTTKRSAASSRIKEEEIVASSIPSADAPPAPAPAAPPAPPVAPVQQPPTLFERQLMRGAIGKASRVRRTALTTPPAEVARPKCIQCNRNRAGSNSVLCAPCYGNAAAADARRDLAQERAADQVGIAVIKNAIKTQRLVRELADASGMAVSDAAQLFYGPDVQSLEAEFANMNARSNSDDL